MVNVAEEVKEARRNLPRAIILTLIITTAFYIVLALVAVLSLPIEELAASKAPLATLIERKAPGLSKTISLIAIVAILNGALIQTIMAARVLYGLSNQGWLPAALGKIHKKTQTPVLATAIVVVFILMFALWLPLAQLAEITSFLMLFVFALVNLALWRVKWRDTAPPDAFLVPIWIPIAGFVASTTVIALRLASLAGF